MLFEKNPKDIIIQLIGEVLVRAYGENYQTVLTMFYDTPFPSPDAYFELSKEQQKLLEDRFTFCITEAAVKDDLQELTSFLEETAEKLRKAHTQIKDTARKWLNSFLCDDKDSFLNFAIYLTHATIFGIDAEKFYLKFTNTRKHGKKMYDLNGLPIFHQLYNYSPVSNTEYVPDMFATEEYGEAYEKAANLFKDIIYVLGGTYKFVVSIDQMAKQAKKYPEFCEKSLLNLTKEVADYLHKAIVTPNQPIPTEAQIAEAKNILPTKLIQLLYSLKKTELSTTLYHEVATDLKNAFGIIAIDRLTHENEIDEIENGMVFSHINDRNERISKAKDARILFGHLDEFMKLEVVIDGKIKKQKISKGNLACLFYYWTGTKMAQIAFVEKYYCTKCQEAKFQLTQSAFNYAFTKLSPKTPLRKAFDEKALEILTKCNNETSASYCITPKGKHKDTTSHRYA